MNEIVKEITSKYWRAKKFIIDSSFHLVPSCKILLYHRVALIGNDPDYLAVSPKNFEAHMRYLKSKYKVISLRKLVENITTNKLSKKNIAVTFDDGYVDNFTNAREILEKYKIPANFFVTTEVTKFHKINSRMNLSQLNELSNMKLFSIGAHAKSHLRLSKFSKKIQKEEIESSKNKLENILGKKVNYFAYPFGQKADFGADTIDLVKKAGYLAAFTAVRGIVTRNSYMFELPRYSVKNWGLQEFRKKVGL